MTVVLEKVKAFVPKFIPYIPGVEIKCGEYEDVRVKLSEAACRLLAGHSFILQKVFDERGQFRFIAGRIIGEVVFRYVSIVSDEIPAYKEIIPAG